MNTRWLLVVLLMLCVGNVQADWRDDLSSLFGGDDEEESEAAEDSGAEGEGEGDASDMLSQLGADEMATGLKQALGDGVRTAINTLGTTDGFMGDSAVRIPVPEKLQFVADGARSLGQEEMVDDFVLSMNRAAEKAVPVTADILGGAIENMSIEDAKGLVQGSETAATDYFRKNSSDSLREAIYPLVSEATSSTGVTEYYKQMQGKAGGLLSGFMDTDDLDLDRYVTDQALDGLFYYIGEQEKAIRANPMERSTDLLKQMFGGG